MARSTKLGPYLGQLGIVPDKELALLAGVSPENVRTYRIRRGIPAGWREEGEPVAAEPAVTEKADETPARKPRKTRKKPQQKKAAKKPRTKKQAADVQPEATAGVVVEAEPVEATSEPVEVAETVEPPVVEVEPAVEPVVEPAPEPEPSASSPTESTRKPRKTKLDPYLDQIGTVPDAEIAERARVTAENVRAYRTRRGIPALWRGEAAEGQPVPRRTAKKKPAPAKKDRRRGSKIDAYADQVGVLPDAKIAEMAGVSLSNIRAYRYARGIPGRRRGKGQPPAPPAEPIPQPTVSTATKARKGKLSPYVEEIGILSDSVIAEKAGTTTQNVRAFRQRHGIPARWRGEGEPLPNEEAILLLAAGPPVAPAGSHDDLPPEADDVLEGTEAGEPGMAAEPAMAPASAPAARTAPARDGLVLEGHEVVVMTDQGEVRYAVLGHGIADAARRAEDGLREQGLAGKIIAIRYIGAALGR